MEVVGYAFRSQSSTVNPYRSPLPPPPPAVRLKPMHACASALRTAMLRSHSASDGHMSPNRYSPQEEASPLWQQPVRMEPCAAVDLVPAPGSSSHAPAAVGPG